MIPTKPTTETVRSTVLNRMLGATGTQSNMPEPCGLRCIHVDVFASVPEPVFWDASTVIGGRVFRDGVDSELAVVVGDG